MAARHGPAPVGCGRGPPFFLAPSALIVRWCWVHVDLDREPLPLTNQRLALIGRRTGPRPRSRDWWSVPVRSAYGGPSRTSSGAIWTRPPFFSSAFGAGRAVVLDIRRP